MTNPHDLFEAAENEKSLDREVAQEAAEYFIERNDEMVSRSEAIKALAEEFDITEGQANRVITQLVDDVVDPVVQVMVDGEKYVGVSDYREGEGWYGYTHFDDVTGRIKRGVCAYCVQDNERDTEIARADEGSGTIPMGSDWRDLEKVINQHYRDHHPDVDQVDVEVGASLLSGTTIAGNVAWHAGNDGVGSGLAADTANSALGIDGIQRQVGEIPQYADLATANAANLPTGTVVYIQSENALYYEDGV